MFSQASVSHSVHRGVSQLHVLSKGWVFLVPGPFWMGGYLWCQVSTRDVQGMVCPGGRYVQVVGMPRVPPQTGDHGIWMGEWAVCILLECFLVQI